MKKLTQAVKDRERLNDIIKAIQEIESLAVNADALDDRKTCLAVAYMIAVVGEASNNLSAAFKERHTHIPWHAIVNMRHRIIHGYAKVDLERLKEAVAQHIPALKRNIIAIFETL